MTKLTDNLYFWKKTPPKNQKKNTIDAAIYMYMTIIYKTSFFIWNRSANRSQI